MCSGHPACLTCRPRLRGKIKAAYYNFVKYLVRLLKFKTEFNVRKSDFIKVTLAPLGARCLKGLRNIRKTFTDTSCGAGKGATCRGGCMGSVSQRVQSRWCWQESPEAHDFSSMKRCLKHHHGEFQHPSTVRSLKRMRQSTTNEASP
jgi:hypothetical protein